MFLLGDEIGWHPACCKAPARDLLVVAGKQNFRNAQTFKFRRAGVVRAIEHARAVRGSRRRERFLLARLFIAQDAWDQPRDAFHHHRRGEFAAAQHVVADRDLIGGTMPGHALVHAFVAAANQGQLRVLCQPLGHRLIEQPPLRGKQHHRRIPRPNLAHGAENRLRLENHSGAAAKRPVVHRAVAVVAEISKIAQPDRDPAASQRALEQAMLEDAREELREDGDYFERHGFKPSGPGPAIWLIKNSRCMSF